MSSWLAALTDLRPANSVPIEVEEDGGQIQLALESENLLLNELILSRAQKGSTRGKGNLSASVRRIETRNWSSKPPTGGIRTRRHKLDSHDPLTQHLESEDQRMNEMILRRAQGPPTNFLPLANDSASQNLLESMRQDSERLRNARAQRQPADTASPDVRRLREEVEDLKRENEIYRSLARQTPRPPRCIDSAEAQRLRDEVDHLRRENERLQTRLIASSPPPPEYAPPPYRSN
ncbi:hypothetical protein C0992_011530 [Termitomyces sp. T32_za158]|nr:hypothetical protein C0992_011530 [Termitomyces sp. T32_za158]